MKHDTEIKVRALFIGERIDTRALETSNLLATSPLTFELLPSSYAVVFKYGAVVLFNINPLEQANFLGKIENLVNKPIEKPEVEDIEIRFEKEILEGFRGDKIILNDSRLIKYQLIAEILAKSTILAYYEKVVAENFDSIEPLAEKLEKESRLVFRSRDLLKQIGRALLQLHKMVGRVEIIEKPELLWENAKLERLYARLEDEYELVERHNALERKIDLISRTAETVLNIMQTRRTLRVEWYIVILIVIEIIITIYELFIH